MSDFTTLLRVLYLDDEMALTREFEMLDILDKQVGRFRLAARLRAVQVARNDNGLNPLDSLGAPRAAS